MVPTCGVPCGAGRRAGGCYSASGSPARRSADPAVLFREADRSLRAQWGGGPPGEASSHEQTRQCSCPHPFLMTNDHPQGCVCGLLKDLRFVQTSVSLQFVGTCAGLLPGSPEEGLQGLVPGPVQAPAVAMEGQGGHAGPHWQQGVPVTLVSIQAPPVGTNRAGGCSLTCYPQLNWHAARWQSGCFVCPPQAGIRSRDAGKQSRTCKRQKRKGSLGTTNTVNTTNPAGPGSTIDQHCIHAVMYGMYCRNDVFMHPIQGCSGRITAPF